MKTLLVGAFKSIEDARTAVANLRDADFEAANIGLMASDDEGETTLRSFKELEGSKTRDAIGAGAGASTGLLWGLGVAAVVLPGVGPAVVGGFFGLGAAAAVVAGLAGALGDMGLSDEDRAYYEEEFKSGSAVVAVACEDVHDFAAAKAILKQNRAYHPEEPSFTESD